MAVSLDSSTKLSLLAKLADGQSRAEVWPTFVEKYGKAIYAWCLKWGASAEDAEDIVQQTLLTVFLKLELFKHGGRLTFRGWLRQIARHTWLKIIEKTAKSKPVDTEEMERLSSIKLLQQSGLVKISLIRLTSSPVKKYATWLLRKFANVSVNRLGRPIS